MLILSFFSRVQMMPEAEKYFDEAVHVFGPRIELFNAVLGAYARLNLFPEALKLLDRIPHEGFEVNMNTIHL